MPLVRRLPLVCLLVLAACLAPLAPAGAEDDPRAVPLFDAKFTPRDVLSIAMEKKKAMTLVLTNGTTYSGFVKSVGDHAIILTRLRGKEFFDAYVPLASIVSMEERVRLR